jgi:hypothetical protein
LVFAFFALSSRNTTKLPPLHVPVKASALAASDNERNRAISIVASRIAQIQTQLDDLTAAGKRIVKAQLSSDGASIKIPEMTPEPPILSPTPPPPPLPHPLPPSSALTADPISAPPDLIPVLVVACCRPSYLRQTLNKLSSLLPPQFRIVVSQDGADASVTQLLQLEFPSLRRLQHITDGQTNYEKIARHYGWALGQVFESRHPPPYALVLEDDMDIAPDFFQCVTCAIWCRCK